jgi:hypothetical protein
MPNKSRRAMRQSEMGARKDLQVPRGGTPFGYGAPRSLEGRIASGKQLETAEIT